MSRDFLRKRARTLGFSSCEDLVMEPPLAWLARETLEYDPTLGKGRVVKSVIAGLDAKSGVLGVTGEDGNEATEFNEGKSALLFLENGRATCWRGV